MASEAITSEKEIMTSTIHPTAIVDPAAELGSGVEIGPYAVVGPNAILENGVKLHNHVSISGRTRLCADVEIYDHAAIGRPPQVLGFKDSEDSRVEIGQRTILREFVTVHSGSPDAGGLTRIGADCLFMSYSHAAHDCDFGDKCVIANSAQIGGHVIVGEQVWMGGQVAVHQHCRIGKHAFVGGGSIVVNHIIPYGSVIGNHAKLAGLNIVGLKRRGFSRQTINDLRAAYRLLFADEGTFAERLDDVEKMHASSPEVINIIDFIRLAKARAICMPG